MEDIIPVTIALMSLATIGFILLGIKNVPSPRRWIRILQLPILAFIGIDYLLYALDLVGIGGGYFLFTRSLRSAYMLLITLMAASNMLQWHGEGKT
jgi:hypothetical protein